MPRKLIETQALLERDRYESLTRTPHTMYDFVTDRDVMIVGIPDGTAVSGGDLQQQLGFEPQACANVSCPWPRTAAIPHAHKKAMIKTSAARNDNILVL
jgi:hypothetical protein